MRQNEYLWSKGLSLEPGQNDPLPKRQGPKQPTLWVPLYCYFNPLLHNPDF